MAAYALLLIISCLIWFLVLSSSSRSVIERCRCNNPFAECWPDAQTWSSFNSSVDGNLIRVAPPAAPCHDPHYDEQACEVARRNWKRTFWRTAQPGAMVVSNWELSGDDGCFIASNRTSACFQGALPFHAVRATKISHVQKAVNFAARYNLRLVIRNTGHDFLGRSTAAGSLSIWMHHLNNIDFHDKFIPDHCPSNANSSSVSAVSVGAGVQWEEVYKAASERNLLVVGGSCPSVGAAGGYPQGGGHSHISPALGLAADNILQYQVVKANGELVKASDCENQDLFWALRGGGGGTFGVVISATHKTHPAFENLISAPYVFTASDRLSFQNLLTTFASLSPALSDDGWSGYFALSKRRLALHLLLPNHTMSFATTSLEPLLSYVEGDTAITVNGSLELASPTYRQWLLKTHCGGEADCSNQEFAGVSLLLASRLIPRKNFQDRFSSSEIAQAMVQIVEEEVPAILVGIAGGRIAEVRDNAVNPAWRQALWFVLITRYWSDNTNQAETEAAAKEVRNANQRLIDLTPGSGTYMNEADFNEPNWQQSFFGEHYNRLYEIKKKVDPTGLFICHHCVGSEDWSRDLNCKAELCDATYDYKRFESHLRDV